MNNIYKLLYINMSGQKLVDFMNYNLNLSEEIFNQIFSDLDLKVISNDIKEIKTINDILYYTTETLEPGAEDNRNWKSVEASWGKITGSITNQTDLKNALSSKVSNEDFNALSGTVNTNTNNISSLNTRISDTSDTVSELDRDINGANGLLIRMQSTELTLSKAILSDKVRLIRVTDDGFLEYSINGTEWHSVSTTGTVEWGDIIGDVSNQADLKLILDGLSKNYRDLSAALSDHINDSDNPHNVSKSSIGLGSVDNTSDLDKPVSNAQRQAIKDLKVTALNYSQHRQLIDDGEIDENTIYLIKDI